MIRHPGAVVVVLAMVVGAMPPGAAAPGPEVAFTFDDLPATRLTSAADGAAMTRRLLDGLGPGGVPAVGFVNEGKLDAVPAERTARTALLERWLDAGHELGNHTYSHLRLADASIEAFQDDVLRGERVTRRLMAARGRTLRFFRHPTLNTGPTRAVKATVTAFLTARGYVIAPVTIDSDEYLYAAAYDRARTGGDSGLARRLADDYLRYMETMVAYDEQLSTRLFDRQIPQVLLLHANWLNADHLPALVGMFSRRGYRFVTLAEALADPAYRTPDDYVGARGPSWLERWAVTRGDAVAPPPAVPDWVRAATP